MRFVDLFCGIGGFHAALHRNGHECIFATDIDKHAAETYEKNWGKPGGFDVHCNIRDVLDDIPKMDAICAGFPCQPFSKSGAQQGFKDKIRGTLFDDICTLAEKHKPKVLFLENVPNLVKHDGGNTFKVVEESIRGLGYSFSWAILSPHKFGIPQVRTRVYIVAIRNDLLKKRQFAFPAETSDGADLDVNVVLDGEADEIYNMTDDEIHWVNMWEEFLKNVNKDTKLPGHPIWADCFTGKEPLPGDLSEYSNEELIDIQNEWSDYGWVKPIDDKMSKEELIKAIGLPKWKQDFIRKNRLLYSNNKRFINRWLKKWKVLEKDEEGNPVIPVSRTKYEWQAGPESRTNWENLFQFRPSGIRVKRGNYFPALVAMVQIPVVGWLKRHLTPKECARLQSFDVDGMFGKPFQLCDVDQQAYKQLGNAVNVHVVNLIQSQIDDFLSGSPDFPRQEPQQQKLDFGDQKLTMKDMMDKHYLLASLTPMSQNDSGITVEGYQFNTALDELFSKLRIMYRRISNQFMRAEIAEELFKDILLRVCPDVFRDLPGNHSGEGDIQWLHNGKWVPISIKYKGPDTKRAKSGDKVFKAPSPSQALSAISWQNTNSRREFSCPMILIWDAERATPSQKKCLDYEKSIFIFSSDELNDNLTLEANNSKSDTAFPLSVIQNIIENSPLRTRTLRNRVDGPKGENSEITIMSWEEAETYSFSFSIRKSS